MPDSGLDLSTSTQQICTFCIFLVKCIWGGGAKLNRISNISKLKIHFPGVLFKIPIKLIFPSKAKSANTHNYIKLTEMYNEC